MTWFPQLSFGHGETSPRLDNLSAPEVYEASCRKLEAAIVSSSGTVEKRNGSTYRGDTAFSTATVTTFTSTAVKLIPFRVGTDTYVLVFEVLTDGTRTWGAIRVVKNDVFYTSTGSDTYTGTQIWKAYTYTHLPFRTQESIGTTGAAADFLPPGGDDSFSKLFGWHHFTAAQLPDVTYFQHEDNLIVCHPDAVPLEVFNTVDTDGTKVLDTRTYEVNRRSPEIIRYGERFTMNVTGGTSGAYTVESSRDWFGEDDIGAIYRIGSLSASHATAVTDVDDNTTTSRAEWDDRGGYFAKVVKVIDKRKCTMSVISALSVSDNAGGLRTYVADVSDPYDWEGPWVKEDATIDYQYYKAGYADLNQGGSPVVFGDSLSYAGVNIIQDDAGSSTSTSPWLSDGTPFHSYSLAGCILGNRADNTATPVNLTRECYLLMTADLFGVPLLQTGSIINGAQAPSASVPGWITAAVETRTDETGGNGGITGQSLYRLRKKSSSKEYAPTVTWSPGYGNTATITDGWRARPSIGDTVYIAVGNITPTALSDWKIAYESIPEDHAQAFNAGAQLGDIGETPTSINTRQYGGTVHVNGGVFALLPSASTVYGVVYIQATVLVPPTSRSATSKYSIGWSKAVGFPSCGISHQGRVVFGGFDMAKRVVVGSEPDRPFDFGLGGTSADGFHFLVNDLRGSRVRWLSSGKDLLIGTTTGEFSITGSPLSAVSVGVDRQSAYGSASVRPVIVGTMLLFVQKDRKTIRAMRFNFDNQRYQSRNVTQEHEHFFSGVTIEEMVVWEGSEDPVVLVRLSDGEVLACRVNEIDGFMGWSRMKLPSCSSITPARNYTAGASSSATAVDSFYMATTDTDKSRLNQYDDTLYLDEAVVAASTTDKSVVLPADDNHLDGQEVSVVLDGVYRGEFTVSAGSPSNINTSSLGLSGAPSTAVVGKKITMALQPRVPETGRSARSASTLGRVKNYSSVIVNLNGSKGVQVNGYEADGTLFSTAVATVSSHPSLQGWYEVPVSGLYGIQPLLEISSDRPYPVEVTGLTIDVSTEG